MSTIELLVEALSTRKGYDKFARLLQYGTFGARPPLRAGSQRLWPC